VYKGVSRFVTALAAGVLFGAAEHPSVAVSGNCTTNQEERTVLTTVLMEVSKHSRSVVVVESKTDSSHFATEFSLRNLLLQDEASELLPKLRVAPSGSTVSLPSPTPVIPAAQQHELEREYKAKLKEPCTIPPLSTGSQGLVFKSPVEVSRILSGNDPRKGWARFHRVFGDDAALVTLSRVAFDTPKQFALVHVSSVVSQNGGGGELYLLNCLNGIWVIKRVFPTWTT